MQCPKCHGAMAPVVFGGIEVDRCTQCGGLWLDSGEKEGLKALKGSAAIDAGVSAAETYKRLDRIVCPHCTTQMTRLVDARQHHIWYENCSVCDGVFFDAGEFSDYQRETLGDFIKSLFIGNREA